MSKRSQKKTTQEPTEVPTETPVEVPTEVPTEIPTETPVEVQMTFNDSIKNALDEIVSLKVQIRNLESTIRNVKNLYKEEMKTNKSSKRRQRKENGEKQVINHGFVKPCAISESLAEFLGLEKGAFLARPDVTKLIAKYVNDNKLWGMKTNKQGENKVNRTIIKADSKLKKLFGEPTIYFSRKKPEEGKGYSYFNLHSYLKRQNHFVSQV